MAVAGGGECDGPARRSGAAAADESRVAIAASKHTDASWVGSWFSLWLWEVELGDGGNLGLRRQVDLRPPAAEASIGGRSTSENGGRCTSGNGGSSCSGTGAGARRELLFVLGRRRLLQPRRRAVHGGAREQQRDENTGDRGRRRGLGFRRVGRSAGVQEKREIGSRLTLHHVGLVPRSRWGALRCRNQPSQSSSLVKHTNVIPLSCSMFMPSHFTRENSLVYLLTLPTIKSIYS